MTQISRNSLHATPARRLPVLRPEDAYSDPVTSRRRPSHASGEERTASTRGRAAHLTVALALCLAPVLAGCGSPLAFPPAPAPAATLETAPKGGDPTSKAATPTRTPTPTPPPAPTPSPVRVSPLTGLPEPSPQQVLVVKLDNTRNAQPHAGLDRADVVYLEEVEYGITRIAAVFSGTIPDRIGPVRSARITDLDLLAQYGAPAFAFSGAQHKLWPAIAKAPVIDISPNKGAKGYARDHDRRAPYNYFLDGRVGINRAKDAALSRDIGFTFADTPPAGGTEVHRATMSWGAASAKFTYDPVDGTYKVNLNGERAQAENSDRGQRASTVVIQLVKQEPSIYFDKGGGNTPHAVTIDTGDAVVLRDGLAYRVRWSRPSAESGTTFTLPDGSVMPFKPGQTWVVLLNRKTPATLIEPTANPSGTGSATPSPSR